MSKLSCHARPGTGGCTAPTLLTGGDLASCACALQVAKIVAPKKAKLAEAEASYQEVMVGLKAKQQELQVCACVYCLLAALWHIGRHALTPSTHAAVCIPPESTRAAVN